MAPDADPYRTLGLTREATLEEVRRAYRRLAKANHPDAAGEAALPRFLAIQAAYDSIAGPDARARRPGAARPTSPRRAWDADRDRTDATYRAYGGRSRRARPGPAGGAGQPGGSGRGEGPPSEGSPGASRPPRPERPPNKATLGSTSYDGAEAEPFEPDWGGASWYGTTSGTYWTLNPKEYADPRKHGPEYQARARRKLAGREEADALDRAAPGEPGGPVETTSSDDRSEPDEPIGGAADRRTGPSMPPTTHTTSTWWEGTVGDPPRPGPSASDRRARRAAGPEGRSAEARPYTTTARTDHSDAALGPDAVIDAVRSWLDDTRPSAFGRVVRGLVGWAPIALGIGWLGGEISGCGRFAAGCDEAVATSAWIAQILILMILLAVGRLARVTSVATLATLTAAVPAALLLSATGNPDDMAAGRLALSGLLVIAWVVGLGFGVVREIRARGHGSSPPESSGPARPVS